jgi:hypothetical protein
MTKAWVALEPGERVALGLSVLLIVSILIHDWMIRSIWIFWLIPLVLLWGSGLLLAVFNFWFGLRDGQDVPRKLRGALAVPAAVLCATLVSLSGVGQVVAASAFLAAHRSDMAQAEAKAGPGQPAALRYIEGVPDGGVAIIRSPVPPRTLPVKVQLRLTGERFAPAGRSCSLPTPATTTDIRPLDGHLPPLPPYAYV